MYITVEDFIRAVVDGPGRRIEGTVTIGIKVYRIVVYLISRDTRSPLIRVDLTEVEG